MLPPPSRPKPVAAAAGGQDSLADNLAEVAPVPEEEEDDKDYFIPNADLIRCGACCHIHTRSLYIL